MFTIMVHYRERCILNVTWGKACGIKCRWTMLKLIFSQWCFPNSQGRALHVKPNMLFHTTFLSNILGVSFSQKWFWQLIQTLVNQESSWELWCLDTFFIFQIPITSNKNTMSQWLSTWFQEKLSTFPTLLTTISTNISTPTVFTRNRKIVD